MRNIVQIILFSILLASCNLISNSNSSSFTETQQTVMKGTIKKELNQYFKDMNKGNWEGVMDRTYPEIFKYASKEQMISIFSSLKEMGVDMFFKSFTLRSVSPPVYNGDEVFHRVFYNSVIDVKLSGMMADNIEVFADEMRKTYGNGVTVDEEKDMVYIKGKSSMVAVSEKEKQEWTFLEFNESKTDFLKKLLTKKVYRSLKAFDEN